MTDANLAPTRGFPQSARHGGFDRGLAMPSAAVAAQCLIGAWIIFGLFGRDPWKPDEAYTFGLVHSIVQTGDWIVPTLAGEPFMEKPPLFFASAAMLVRLFGNLLAPHDAARLATALYCGLTILFAALTARKLYGNDRAMACALILIGCLGYLHAAHLLITDNALVAGIAIALYGLANILERPGWGGIVLGTGAGIAFLSKGLIGPGFIGLTAATLALLPAWRTRHYGRALLWAAAAFAPWALLWPCLLYRQSPELFHEWFVVNNFGRYFGRVQLGPGRDPLMFVWMLPWFALPALPLAVWHAWNAVKAGRKPWKKPEIQLPLVAASVMLAVLSLSCTARDLYALPTLVPLSVLASAQVPASPRWLAIALHRLAIGIGALLALGIWGVWIAWRVHWPAGIAEWLEAGRPGFVPRLEPGMTFLALSATAGWLLLVRVSRNSADRIALGWAAGVTLAWALFMTLWLSYQDAGNSYRSLVAEIRGRLPASMTCMANRDLGEPQRAMLDYFAGIVTHSVSSPAAAQCDWLLVQTGHWPNEAPQARHWAFVWSGSRPGDDAERFWLYQRIP
jgi:4-amino-4-deoxy-L-arabinose transferase-like glycosyltransferase